MVGLRSLTFIRDSIKHNIYGIHTTDIKTGVMGLVGNKGSIITSLYIGDSLIHFANTHLPSGSSPGKRAECIKSLYQTKIEKERSDFFFLFGDLNLRVQMKLEEFKPIMKDFESKNPDINWQKLKERDEVATGDQPCLQTYFKEAPLVDLPTYRIVRGTQKYSDERVASWTDRIFFHHEHEDFDVKVIDFGSCISDFSDHL